MAPPPSKKKKTIVDEDVYEEALSKIIERDFYPDLEKLQKQQEVLSF